MQHLPAGFPLQAPSARVTVTNLTHAALLSNCVYKIPSESLSDAYKNAAASDSIFNDFLGHIHRMINRAGILVHVVTTMARIKALFARLVRGDVLKRYRPERHYMRGPGPQWHAKHDSLPFTR